MNTQTRSEIIAKFKEEIANGKILVGVGAGTGITAKSSEAGGADMLIIYNSGRYRMAGRGSLAGLLSYGDANQIVVEMGAEVLPVVKHTPVLAGVCGTDPFRVMDIYLKQLKDQGFNGVQNFPTVGLIDGIFRQNLEETGMGYLPLRIRSRAGKGHGRSRCGHTRCPYGSYHQGHHRRQDRAHP
mgnify:CR=1 FL=1